MKETYEISHITTFTAYGFNMIISTCTWLCELELQNTQIGVLKTEKETLSSEVKRKGRREGGGKKEREEGKGEERREGGGKGKLGGKKGREGEAKREEGKGRGRRREERRREGEAGRKSREWKEKGKGREGKGRKGRGKDKEWGRWGAKIGVRKIFFLP